jgi:hypothetical protein
MNKYFSDWYREVNLEFDEPTLEKRWEGIEALTSKISKVYESVLEIVKVFLGLPNKGESFIDKLCENFKKTDATFPMRSNNNELKVLSGATIVQLIETKSTDFASLVSLAVLCGGFQSSRKVLLNDVFLIAQQHLKTASLEMRQAINHVNHKINKIDLNNELIELKKNIEGNLFPNSQAQFEAIFKKIISSINSISATHAGFENTILLQQEEMDILWWIINKTSKYFLKSFVELGFYSSILVIPKELADITKILPGPYAANIFIDSMLSNFEEYENGSVTIQRAVNESSREWRKEVIDQYDIDPIFPLHFAIYKSLETDNVDDWVSAVENGCKLKLKKKYAPNLISYQFYQECLLIKRVTV